MVYDSPNMDEAARQAGPKLRDAIHNLLNSREQVEFVEILKDYQSRRNVEELTETLQTLLDTPAKRHLIDVLREVIHEDDRHLFDQRMMGLHEGHYTNSLPRSFGRGSAAGAFTSPAGSAMSLPARHYQGVPSQARNSGRSAAGNHRPLASGTSWDHTGSGNDIKRIYMEQTSSAHTGLGFSIRGGAEHGIGIYVSYVDLESVAERQGLTPGDQILAVNDISLLKVTHKEAARIIKSSRKLELEVRHVGRIPGSFETHQKYTWVDALGRTVSPPPEVDRTGRYDHTSEERKSDLMLLKASDERKVNLVVNDSKTLGLMIRGGSEFGLGIYLTGVDAGSIAENSGLKVGDQLLDVNGQSFLDITHAEAVKVLKASKHLMITIKDVGKLPYARTTYDHTQWVTSTGGKLQKAHGSRSDPALSNGSSGGSTHDSIFTKGAGSQLMHNSVSGQSTQIGLLKEHARQLLKDQERMSMNYYLQEYSSETTSVEAMVKSLSRLFDTPAKFSLMSEIRGLVTPRDIEKFDELVAEWENSTFKSTSVSMVSADSEVDLVVENSLRRKKKKPLVHESMNGGDSDDDMHALHKAIGEISDDLDLDPTTSSSQLHTYKKSKGKSKSKAAVKRSKSPTDVSTNYVVAEVHNPPVHLAARNGTKLEDAGRSPSEDSGVEINGTHVGPADSARQAHQKVTMSSQDPVVFGDSKRRPVSNKQSRWTEERIADLEKVQVPPLKMTNIHKTKASSFDGDALRKKVLLSNVKPYRTKAYLNTSSPSLSLDSKGFLDSKTTTVEDIHLDEVHEQRSTQRNKDSVTDREDSRRHGSKKGVSPDSSPDRGRKSSGHAGQNGRGSASSLHRNSSTASADSVDFSRGPRQRPPGQMIEPPGRNLPSPSSSHGSVNHPQGGEDVAQLPEGVVKKIAIHRTQRSLGLAIEGGANTRQPLPRISTIQPNGSGHSAEGLRVGQIILKVNGRSLEGLGHLDCAKVIARAFKDKERDHMELTVLDTLKEV